MIASAASSALLTALTIRYAYRRRMIDQPGQRRSHSVPTARGGGIAIVGAILVCAVAPMLLIPANDVAETSPRSWVVASTLALLIVAVTGWIDDRGGLSARVRFGAHCLAGFVLLTPLVPDIDSLWPLDAGLPPTAGMAIALFIALVFVLSIAWSINLHNFMDGINGLLASQAIFVLALLGLANWLHGMESGPAVLTAAAAVAGFLPFNFPRARIFMGDVGSGALGLLVAIAVLSSFFNPMPNWTIVALIACSAFVTDATATLLSRMLRGRRWYSAHREHLYQWLVRSGYSHAQVVGFYIGWNVIVVVPAVVVLQSGLVPMSPSRRPFEVSLTGLVTLMLIYALALAIWIVGKRYSLARVRAGRSDGIA